MNPPRRPRSNIRKLDAIKAAAIIIALLLACILTIGIVTRMMQPKEIPPVLTPRPSKSLWEEPVPAP